MKTAARVLGLLGGVIGLAQAAWRMFYEARAMPGDSMAGGMIVLLGLVTGLFSLLGVLAALQSFKRPALSGFGQLGVAVVCLFGAAFVPLALFVAGGVCALIGWRQTRTNGGIQ